MNAVEIKLTRGVVALIDPEDEARVRAHRWHALWTPSGRLYARRWQTVEKVQKAVLLHRWIMNAPLGSEVDHINGDPLDNRRSNLRLASRAQNLWNSKPRKGSATIGVRRAPSGKWTARIWSPVRGWIWLGSFEIKAEAIGARDRAVLRLHGTFGRLNEPERYEASLGWLRRHTTRWLPAVTHSGEQGDQVHVDV